MNFLRRRWRGQEPRVVDEFGTVGAADGWALKVIRGREVESSVHHGPNIWHALVVHPDGSWDQSFGRTC